MKNSTTMTRRAAWLACLFCLCFSTGLFAQVKYQCALDEALRGRQPQAAAKDGIANKAKTTNPANRAQNDVLYLRTVVHVLYNTPDQNISDDAILGMMEEVNKVYRKEIDTNLILPELQPFSADSRIQLCLAKADPNGNPTTGINHIQSDVVGFSFDISEQEQIKTTSLGGADPWDTDQYFNIWIGAIEDETIAVSWGIPRADYLPLGPITSAELGGNIVPGVVLDADLFQFPSPPSNVLNHEIGHALGLQHTHGDPPDFDSACDYDDAIADTPLCGFPPDVCGTLGVNTCIEPVNDLPDDISNIMYYACSVMITQQQAERMYENLTQLGPTGFFQSTCADFAAGFTALGPKTICAGGDVQFDFTGAGATTWSWAFEGGTPATSSDENPLTIYASPGVYGVELTVSDGTNQNSVSQTGYITVVPQPSAVITHNDGASSPMASDGSVQVEVFGGVAPYTYSLQPGNLTSSTGLFEGLPVGNYTVTATSDGTDCTVSLPVAVSVVSGVAENERLLSQIGISPNPNGGQFEVRIEQPLPEAATLSLFDVTGRLLKTEAVLPNSAYRASWDVPGLAAGLYFLRVKTMGHAGALKLVVR